MLTLETLMPFGKYKGRLVSEVLADDPEYFLWLRNQKLADTGEAAARAAFNNDIHALLNTYLDTNPKLMTKKGYKKMANTGAPVNVVAELPEAEHETLSVALTGKPAAKHEYQDWGAW